MLISTVHSTGLGRRKPLLLLFLRFPGSGTSNRALVILVSARNRAFAVIPAKAGTQANFDGLGPDFRRGDVKNKPSKRPEFRIDSVPSERVPETGNPEGHETG
jgi:hypothetical protein